MPTTQTSGLISIVIERIGDLPLVEIEQLLHSLDSRKARLVVVHPLLRTDKAGLLGSQQQSGRYLTALLRVSHVFHPSEGLIPSTRPAEFHYR
jgi:hypothetical protein